MRLQCLVCKHQFEPSERFVELTGHVKHENGIQQGVCLAICRKHLSEEVIDALLFTTAAGMTFQWSNHTHQVYAEHRVFGDK